MIVFKMVAVLILCIVIGGCSSEPPTTEGDSMSLEELVGSNFEVLAILGTEEVEGAMTTKKKKDPKKPKGPKPQAKLCCTFKDSDGRTIPCKSAVSCSFCNRVCERMGRKQ